MPRKPRMYLPGIPCHVIQRGNNRDACFFAEQDYQFYLECLKDACRRYIELNPVRANMVQHPAEYRWSSYRTNGQGEPCFLTTSHPIYTALGFNASYFSARCSVKKA